MIKELNGQQLEFIARCVSHLISAEDTNVRESEIPNDVAQIGYIGLVHMSEELFVSDAYQSFMELHLP